MSRKKKFEFYLNEGQKSTCINYFQQYEIDQSLYHTLSCYVKWILYNKICTMAGCRWEAKTSIKSELLSQEVYG